jgi:TonB family protein
MRKIPFLVALAALALIGCGDKDKSKNAEAQDPFALSTLLPQAELPTLKIDGKENPDVYLQSLDIQVEVTGNIATTRYTMVFRNKTNRVLEGNLTFPLPDGRSITHYALDINGKMREAVPVEKARGTQVFEEIQQRRVDPGLLERVESNNFRTRIYPLPANGTRTISIGYEEDLPLEKGLLHYRLPMAYPDSLEKFAVNVTIWKSSQKPIVPESKDEIQFDKAGENYVASFAKENYRPSRALIFALPVLAEIPQAMMQPAQGSHYFYVSVVPNMETRKKQWSDELAIIWDVSLSGSQRNLQREMEMLDIIFAEKKDANVNLYFLNNRFTAKGEYKVVKGKWDELKKILATADFDGGTNFSEINLDDIAGNEILFFSDGLSTLSDADFFKNAKEYRPMHCIVSSSKADYSVMKLIADKTKGKFVNINALFSENLKSELLNETLQFLGTEHGEEIREVYPSIAMPVQGSFSIAGISDADKTEMTLLFGFGSNAEKRIIVQLDAKEAANQGNVYKIWAQKKIAELDLNYEKNHAELIELGQQFGIVTRNTSLIVLETISDYVLYGIEPPATEPELRAEYQLRKAGGGQKLKLSANSQFSDNSLMRDKDFARDIDRVLENVAGLQTSGKTELGGRRGSATGGFNDGYAEGGSDIGDMLGGLMGGSAGGIGTKAKGGLKAPSARDIDMGSGDGSRSKAEILAVVNSRMPGLRNIYNKYLKLDPKLNGKVTLKFTIDHSGDVISISTISSTTGYPEFDNAVKNMVATWKWKSINGGNNTTPTIPFNFNNDEPIIKSPEPREPSVPREPQPRKSRAIVAAPKKEPYNMLNAAVDAAGILKTWHNKSFTQYSFKSEKSKYPVPNEIRSISDMNVAKASSDYLNKLTGEIEVDYKIYLKLRNDYASSPTYYFDMAKWFYTHGDKEIALRILTSIADLELENASLYKLLGYRFKEYDEYALEKFICQKVIEWRPIEPQSYRDYALALADNGEMQAALDSLYSLLTRSYSDNILGRSRGIEEVVVTEINHLIAKYPNLNISKIDKRLIINIPVDIRVVINWNMDNTDIDLHVKDPNGEECSYRYRETIIGGRINGDIRNGYGPEQFMLKKAIPGKYQVYVNYYGDRQFTAAGPSTIMAEIYTKYAGKTEERKVVSLQMSNARQVGDRKAIVAEFSF